MLLLLLVLVAFVVLILIVGSIVIFVIIAVIQWRWWRQLVIFVVFVVLVVIIIVRIIFVILLVFIFVLVIVLLLLLLGLLLGRLAHTVRQHELRCLLHVLRQHVSAPRHGGDSARSLQQINFRTMAGTKSLRAQLSGKHQHRIAHLNLRQQLTRCLNLRCQGSGFFRILLTKRKGIVTIC